MLRQASDNCGTVTETGEGTNSYNAIVTAGGRELTITFEESGNALITNTKSGETAEYLHKWLTVDGKEVKINPNKTKTTLRDGIYFVNKLVKLFMRPVKQEKVAKEKVAKAPKEPKVKKEKIVKEKKAKKQKVRDGEVVLPLTSEVIEEGEIFAFILNNKKFFYDEKEIAGLKCIEVTRNKESVSAALGNRTVEEVRNELALTLVHERNIKVAAKK